MQNPIQPESQLAQAKNAATFSPHDAGEDSLISLAAFIERKFIPHHVELKSLSGRTHYQAILKHILRPETVERLFTPYVRTAKARLKAAPDWPYLDDTRLCDLNADHVRQLTSSASARGYSHQTVKHIRNVMSAIVSHARREHMFNGDNPISEVELPPMPHKESHNLTIVEAKTILGMMKYPEREIALITITVGMSISEICALQWKHVNLTGSTIYADGKLVPPRSILVSRQWNAVGVVEANSNRVRQVTIPDPLIQALARLRRRHDNADSNSFVIANREGNPIRPSSVGTLRLKPIGRELEMPWLSWQVLKRAHDALLSELRVQLTDDLVLSTRDNREGGPQWPTARRKSGQARYARVGLTPRLRPGDVAFPPTSDTQECARQEPQTTPANVQETGA
jgi:integrase